MNEQNGVDDPRYHEALATVRHTLERFRGCSDDEKQRLAADITELEQMLEKLNRGRVHIVVFGEISTGKSALINALVGDAVTEVDVRGGWTKEAWEIPWETSGYCVPGFGETEVVLIDTPGLNEVGGESRTDIAQEAAGSADLIIFVTDSDLNDTEFTALARLASISKPILVALNKVDLYNDQQRKQLVDVLTGDRLRELLPAEHVVCTAAHPRERERVIESADGSVRSEWITPEPDVEDLKVKILETLQNDGLALLALNAAMYAADKSDRIAALRVELRSTLATKTIWSYASVKAVAVAVNSVPIADVVGGGAVDVTMVLTLSRIYGIEMTWAHAKELVTSIAKAAGWMAVSEIATHLASWTLKFFTLGGGTLVTALPQGAAAGYGSYIVGQAARYYFEHGASWGGEAPKTVISRILKDTDKQSILNHLKEDIQEKIKGNPHAK